MLIFVLKNTMMKQIALSIISVLFVVAIHGSSIDYLLKKFNNIDLVLDEDLCYEEENEGEEKSSEEENETDKLMDELFSNHKSSAIFSEFIPSHHFENNNFYYSEYFKIIYSPPELA